MKCSEINKNTEDLRHHTVDTLINKTIIKFFLLQQIRHFWGVITVKYRSHLNVYIHAHKEFSSCTIFQYIMDILCQKLI